MAGSEKEQEKLGSFYTYSWNVHANAVLDAGGHSVTVVWVQGPRVSLHYNYT